MIAACDLAPAHIKAIAAYQPGKPASELAREKSRREQHHQTCVEREPPWRESRRDQGDRACVERNCAVSRWRRL